MNSEIEPDEAIQKIIALSNQIDPLLNMTYKDGDRAKTQLIRRIKGFIQAAFKDDDKKIQDLQRDLKHFRYSGMTEETYQKNYINDLEAMRDYLIVFKEELELFSKSRNRTLKKQSEDKTINNETKMEAIHGPTIPIPSPTEEFTIDKEGFYDTRPMNSNKIFVVHGHNNTIKDAVAAFLRSLNLDPIILHQQPSLGKTIIEKVEHYSDVGYAVILLTQDDLGCSLGEPEIVSVEEKGGLFSKKESVVHARRAGGRQQTRARQNVIFEFGFFIGKLGRSKVAALCEQGIERPSDIEGLVYISLDNQGDWREKVKKEIEAAGVKTGLKKLD